MTPSQFPSALELLDQARQCDAADPIASFREEFYFPQTDAGQDELYFVGNSLGLQPKRTREFVMQELDAWQSLGVRGHFQGDYPWMPYHEFLADGMAQIVGAQADEVVVMNTLTVNLHLMMASFYRPKGNEIEFSWSVTHFRRTITLSNLRSNGTDWNLPNVWC